MDPRYFLHHFASVLDAVTAGMARLAIQKLGTPPAEWVFITLGSMGREEYLPGSDQDNALVWKHSGGNLEAERAYFLSFGELICASLEKAGLALCPASVMASNPVWNAPLHEWIKRLENNIREPEPKKLLDLEIFLDFRAVAGNFELANNLREEALTFMKYEPSLFIHLAQNVRQRKTPGNSFRSAGNVNLKELSASFSGFTRVYALKNAVTVTNTFDRLQELMDKDVLKPALAGQLMDAYASVMTMRLVHALGHESFSLREEALLQYAIEQASLFQKKIEFDFLGSAF